MRDLTPQPLTRAGFAPFGDVIEISDEAEKRIINYGNAERYHDLAALDLAAEGGKPIVSVFRAKPQMLPFDICVMERHPLSSQAFIPLESRPYLVAVAPAGDFDAAEIRVFLARPDQGVNYHAGTWHHFLIAQIARTDFLVIDREGSGNNLDEVMLPEGERPRIVAP